MRVMRDIFRNAVKFTKEYKFYFFAPAFVLLILLIILICYIGPVSFKSFIYAGF
ncbi:MAG: hypothetical protein WBE75_07210 [Candidatus Omnitrophota bacterium]|jgi:hypothetical protein